MHISIYRLLDEYELTGEQKHTRQLFPLSIVLLQILS